MDTTSSIFKSARHFFSGTLLSRISGVLRDITMAYTFGATPAVAAFFVAFRLAHLLRRILGEGAMQTTFVPHFESLKLKHPDRACRFFINLHAALITGLIGLILLTIFSLKSLSFFFPLSDYQEIISLTIWMLPSLLFICLFGLNSSILQCEKRYFISGIAPVAFNLTWVFGALTIAWYNVQYPMHCLAIFVIIGCMLQWLITLPSTLKTLQGHKLLKNIDLRSEDLKKMARPLCLAVLGVGASQINNALDVIFARIADPEGPAVLWYAIRIQQLPLALFGMALSTALMPPLSRAAKSGNWKQYRQFFHFAQKSALFIMLPMTFAGLLFGKTAIEWLYFHGSFDAQAVLDTNKCLSAYFLGLIPMALILIWAPRFYSRNDFHTPAIASSAAMIINMSLNGYFIFFLGYGATSVALATSISAWCNLGYLIYKKNN